MSSFMAPSFGLPNNNQQQGYGSPKNFHSTMMYQPMPAVGTPSFGGLGRPMTPKEPSRHSTFSPGGVEPTIQPIQPSVERVRRHREYYLEGGDIYFLVENYLFRVHRYFFDRESPVFRKQFADSALNGHHRVGASDNDPLVLNDVRTDDFSRFLWVFYNPIYSLYDASTEDWAAILGLAHHWQFSEVKALVVRELEKQIVPSIYKIVIYHRYEVDRGLLLPSYMDLVSREETLNFEEAKDLGLETSLMIMTAREVVRRGEAPTSTVNVSVEDLRNIIRQIFRFPGPRSDTPLSDITAAEPTDHRSPPLVAEKTDLPTVPEHENEPVTFTTSASLSSSLPPKTETQVPAPPAPAPSTPKKQAPSKQTPATPKKEDTKPAPPSPPKEEPKPKEESKPKEEPAKPALFPTRKDEFKPSIREPSKPTTEEPPKPEAQKKPLLSRLSDVTKAADSLNPAKDKEGDKLTENKEAKNARSTTDEKDVTGPPASGQDPNATPIGTPLMNQDTDHPGTPSTGQSVSARRAQTLLARAGEIKRRVAQEMDLNSSTKDKDKGKDKETRESLKTPAPINPVSQAGSEPQEPASGAKKVETKMGVSGKGKKKVAGNEEKVEGKPAKAADVDGPKGRVKMDSPGDRKKVDEDTKKPGVVDSLDNVTPAVTTDETTKPVADDANAILPATTTSEASGPKVPSVVADAVPSLDTKGGATQEEAGSSAENTAGPEGKGGKVEAEPVVTDEGDVATPKRATRELPASPAKSLKGKVVPTLSLAVPKPPKNGLAHLSQEPVAASPLQKALEDAEDETLMERVARLHLGDTNYQPPKDMVPPAHTDLESDFDCVTAPSGPCTPRSRAGRGSFNLILRSEVPLSDDDDFFLDCDSNASVSNFGGV